MKSPTKATLMPLVLLWLAAHAALLALILAVKFLTAKTVLLAMLVMGSLVFLSAQFRAKPRKLSHSP
jgi:uncharacterized membrane protein